MALGVHVSASPLQVADLLVGLRDSRGSQACVADSTAESEGTEQKQSTTASLRTASSCLQSSFATHPWHRVSANAREVQQQHLQGEEGNIKVAAAHHCARCLLSAQRNFPVEKGRGAVSLETFSMATHALTHRGSCHTAKNTDDFPPAMTGRHRAAACSTHRVCWTKCWWSLASA